MDNLWVSYWDMHWACKTAPSWDSYWATPMVVQLVAQKVDLMVLNGVLRMVDWSAVLRDD